jgi:uncharacterized membrane protein (UPF0127 family)
MLVVNRTRGTLLGVDVARADSVGARMRGLYAYRHLMLGDGLWLVPCNNIQTFGMKHVIDVIFLDQEYRVVRICEHLQPGRFTWWVRRAHSALELPAGAVRSSETQVGDLLDFAEASGTPVAPAPEAGRQAGGRVEPGDPPPVADPAEERNP